MLKLLIIADDFTGALDTGVQFAVCGAKTRVVTRADADLTRIDSEIQVLVMDTETRHLDCGEARRIVYDVSKRAVSAGIPYIYKKTDSALRGNVGAELEALLAASGEKQLSFVPAFPQMHRITRNSVQYIDGVPVEDSAFGHDPFNPVNCSYVPDLLAGQCGVPIAAASFDPDRTRLPDTAGIVVWDAESARQIENIAAALFERGRLRIMAGCAGFAQALPKLLQINGPALPVPSLPGRFRVVCGSVHPVTREQIRYAEEDGFARMALTPRQKLEPGYWDSQDGRRELYRLDALFGENPCGIVETNDPENTGGTMEYAKKYGLTLEEVRNAIPRSLAVLVECMWQREEEAALLITGGDTLMACMTHLGVYEMDPVCEMAPGTVLASCTYNGRTRYLMTKSGGFGRRELFVELKNKLSINNQNKETGGK